ncbi:relaxase/mobilization nuclease domain-containing protein [Variovorax saccharolyticus]|uniref:relaxase/mobilization nuclease domain-containing protein n=1 Tax=Variovorax saccharolyticus TaxID=3053516 RepID=UPI002577E746|nr:relaxase/mobilization nuclease domain-containing protein [Variovorax sp. J31P216]MDM0030392.1 relaxase/mobilization nuclease domain-containing protein [Variovorax sp. J31P216]
MPKRMVALPRTSGLMELDIVSYGRRGPGAPAALNIDQIEQVKRTVGRSPEVMVKVSGGAREAGGVRAHLQYLDRHGKLEIETDEGGVLRGRGIAEGLISDWQLDLCRSQYRAKPVGGERDTRAKLVHNIVLSMPAGTPPQKVLRAARGFARENFALQYRYAMVLHTDQAHPHVHLVVKCEHEFEPGKRLYVRKETLRLWREQFATLLREEGVAANATPRQLRGTRKGLKDPIHHRLRDLQSAAAAARAGTVPSRAAPKESSFMRKRLMDILEDLQAGRVVANKVTANLAATRAEVVGGWHETAEKLRRQGLGSLANQVENFVRNMPTPVTDRMHLQERLMAELDGQRRRAQGQGRNGPAR